MLRQRLWNLKPLSLNSAFSGRHFKTPAYKAYEQEVFYKLPKKLKIPEGELRLVITFGFSNRGADIDNCCKLFIDLLSKAYNFNDNRIYALSVFKEIVKKGEEFIEFFIETL